MPTLQFGKGKHSHAHFTDQKIKSHWVSQGWGLMDTTEKIHLEETEWCFKPEVSQEAGVKPFHIRLGRRWLPTPTKDVLNVRNYLLENGLEGRPC